MTNTKFIFFLYPYPIRNTEAPHIWSLYKGLEKMNPENIFCIGSQDYFKDAKYYQNRWESSWANKGWLKSDNIPNQNKYIIDTKIFSSLEQQLLTPNRVWTSLISEPYDPLISVLKQHIKSITENNKIAAIFTLCNCASLKQAAEEYNIPLVHIELGALRSPHYINTSYFDFSGVNGNTESAERYAKFHQELTQNKNKPSFFSREELLSFIKQKADKSKVSFLKKLRRQIKNKLRNSKPNQFEIGIPLQVEDDSNMLAYNNGFNNIELMSYAHKFFNKNSTLVRKHPGGHAIYKAKNDDNSIYPAEFIKRCKRIITTNSSMGLEGLLYNKPTWIMGENPFKFCASQNPSLDNYQETEQLTEKLNFSIFGYMVPSELVFSPEYIRFRLNNPTELEIYQKHLQYWNDK